MIMEEYLNSNKLHGRYLMVLALMAASSTVSAMECYSFGKQTANDEYHVGDTADARHSKIKFHTFYFEKDRPAQADVQFGRIHNGRIAQGETPELKLNMISVQVKPVSPISKVRFKFAENANALVANLGVNGKRLIVNGGLQNADGKILGNNQTGKARIKVVTTPSPLENGGFNTGTIEVTAVRGKIHKVMVGGQILHIDDFCIKQ